MTNQIRWQNKSECQQTSLVRVVEGVVHEARDERGLPHRLLAQEHQLELSQRVAKVAGGRHGDVAALLAPLTAVSLWSVGNTNSISSVSVSIFSF